MSDAAGGAAEGCQPPFAMPQLDIAARGEILDTRLRHARQGRAVAVREQHGAQSGLVRQADIEVRHPAILTVENTRVTVRRA